MIIIDRDTIEQIFSKEEVVTDIILSSHVVDTTVTLGYGSIMYNTGTGNIAVFLYPNPGPFSNDYIIDFQCILYCNGQAEVTLTNEVITRSWLANGKWLLCSRTFIDCYAAVTEEQQ